MHEKKKKSRASVGRDKKIYKQKPNKKKRKSEEGKKAEKEWREYERGRGDTTRPAK